MDIFSGAVATAIAETHELDLPTARQDVHGLYCLDPDGHKEYVSEAEAAEILKGRTRYNTDSETLKTPGNKRE